MKKCLALSVLVLLCGCITATEAVWKTIPEVKETSYDNAWSIIVGCVSENYDLEITDSGSGYLRTAWKTKSDWLGQPSKRTRIVVRIVSKEPLKVKLKAQRQRRLGEGWNEDGNDEKVESQILEELTARLK